MSSRRSVLLGWALSVIAGWSGTAPGQAAEPARQPNIVFILADDLGWTDLGCQGSGFYPTPNIDRLAAQGVRFRHAYTCGPNCQPTRAALVTGQYGPRTGIYTVGAEPRGRAEDRKLEPVPNVVNLPRDKATVAQALKAAGYATALFGKWHLGNGQGYHPLDRGYDEAIVSMGRHFDFATNPRVEVPEGTYLADFLTDKAVDFIERHKDRPFFLDLHHFAVHVPLEAKPDQIARFQGRPPVNGHGDPVYTAMIASIDDSVGRVLAQLDALKLADDTVVIFSSDNGGVGGYVSAGIPGARDITNNAPLRGGKGMLYEGGVRVPWIVRWPGIAPSGTTCDQPIASIDFFPTALELAGAQPETGATLDGVSLVPLFQNPSSASWSRETLYWHFPGYLEGGNRRGSWRTTPAGAIRRGDWKLLEFFEDNHVELYNLKDDPGQHRDFAADLPSLANDLRDRLRAWRAEVQAPMPQPNPAHRP